MTTPVRAALSHFFTIPTPSTDRGVQPHMRFLNLGDTVSITLPGVGHAVGEITRILDRRGRRLEFVDLRDPPAYAMLVVRVDGHDRCVPLWHAPGEAALVREDEVLYLSAG